VFKVKCVNRNRLLFVIQTEVKVNFGSGFVLGGIKMKINESRQEGLGIER